MIQYERRKNTEKRRKFTDKKANIGNQTSCILLEQQQIFVEGAQTTQFLFVRK